MYKYKYKYKHKYKYIAVCLSLNLSISQNGNTENVMLQLTLLHYVFNCIKYSIITINVKCTGV